jgi:hypothetical protein
VKFNNISTAVFVLATVYTDAGSEMTGNIKKVSKISASPYSFSDGWRVNFLTKKEKNEILKSQPLSFVLNCWFTLFFALTVLSLGN